MALEHETLWAEQAQGTLNLTDCERRTVDQIAHTARSTIHPGRHFIGFTPRNRQRFGWRSGSDQRPSFVRAALLRLGFSVTSYLPPDGTAVIHAN